MTPDEALENPVFLAALYEIGGSEGAVERLSPADRQALAVIFAAGKNYAHPMLPRAGETVESVAKDGEQLWALTVDEPRGAVYLFNARDPNGDGYYLFLDPDKKISWRFRPDADANADENNESWK